MYRIHVHITPCIIYTYISRNKTSIVLAINAPFSMYVCMAYILSLNILSRDTTVTAAWKKEKRKSNQIVVRTCREIDPEELYGNVNTIGQWLIGEAKGCIDSNWWSRRIAEVSGETPAPHLYQPGVAGTSVAQCGSMWRNRAHQPPIGVCLEPSPDNCTKSIKDDIYMLCCIYRYMYIVLYSLIFTRYERMIYWYIVVFPLLLSSPYTPLIPLFFERWAIYICMWRKKKQKSK